MYGLDTLTQNPVIIVLVIDAIMGVVILKRALHPILGNFDIALILQPLGDDKDIPPPKADMTEKEQQIYVEKFLKGKIFTTAGRIEFNPLKEAFRMGKKDNGFTYKVNPKKVAFLQRTHRVYEYVKGLAYPISVYYGAPEKFTTSKGMDMFVALRLWRDAIAATKKLNTNFPIAIGIVCIMMGLFGGFALFYGLHTYLGFENIPYSAPVINATTHSTATLGNP